MVTVIGTTFPATWQYGPEEIEIYRSTATQIDQHFPDQRNLLINTTWFGPQFNNNEWAKAQRLIANKETFDNLFLLSVIDPLYLSDKDTTYLECNLQTTATYRIGMFAHSKFEWNFHSVVGAKYCPDLTVQEIKLTWPEHTFLLYQRKPRRHRVELTELLIKRGYDTDGVITLGSNKNSSYDWSEGLSSKLITIEDLPSNYKHNGQHDDFGGVPNDLVTLGRLDIWQRHFLNVVSETQFNNWDPTFITEKTWKPIIGLRPFVIHGQRNVYSWLQNNGFQTFNHYWSHIPCDTGEDQHGNVIDVIDFLCKKSKDELVCMYADMLPVLEYNRSRFFEFAQEQKYKMNHLFQTREHV
jgi:hypothetical protein